MKTIIYIFLIFSLLAACAPLTPAPDAPVSSNETPVRGSETPQRPSLPLPEDTTLERGPAFVDSAEVLILESFPPQYMLSLAGSLPTPCHQLRVNVSPPDAENVIVVTVYSLVDPNMICIQVLQSFAENINLGSFAPGKYAVQIDGGPILEFDAP